MPPLDRPTKRHPLRIYFGGDSLAGMPGMWLGILRQEDGLAKVRADYVESSRLTYGEPVDWPAHLKRQMARDRYDVGVFMIGANDSGMPMIVGGRSVMYPKRAWLDEYERRAKQIAAIMLRAGVKRVYWVGMPIMPGASESRKMRELNRLFEHVAASSPDVEYVDSYDLLSTKSGHFKPSLRSGDGIHYTDEGARTVARAVWRAIRQDWGGK
ncbi:MAG TPA: GDSL-type esterase/lipase family protein [Thermoleophilia bacterium]|nr:GDSL-type esterase/lipase family protein [Thermoleophilia bacterium]